MTDTQPNPNDLFWLARYAHNTLAPLFEQAKAAEPTLQFSIELIFGHEGAVHSWEPHLNVNAHWGRDGMFQMSPWLRTQAEVDRFAAMVAADAAKLGTLVAA